MLDSDFGLGILDCFVVELVTLGVVQVGGCWWWLGLFGWGGFVCVVGRLHCLGGCLVDLPLVLFWIFGVLVVCGLISFGV